MMVWLKVLCLLPLLLCRLSGTSSLEDEGTAHAVGLVGQPEQSGTQQTPVAIVIMALARSGSTLIGQLFRQNKDVLYFYEPCRANGGGVLGRHEMLIREECFGLARRLTRCEFTLHDSDRLTVDENAAYYNSLAAANVHRRVKESRSNANTTSEDALAGAHDALMKTCKASRAVATKTIRLLDGVGHTPEYETSGVHVLHLVRDPRAVVRSQILMRGLKGFRDVLPNSQEIDAISDWRQRQTETRRAVGLFVCQNYRNQLDSAGYLDGDQYLRIRYEDFAMVPQVLTELVYCWSGLGKVPPSLAAWVDDNTKMENCEDPTRRQLAALAADALGGGSGGVSGAREGMAMTEDDRGVEGREEGGSAGSSRTGNLRHINRFAAVSAVVGTESVSRLPPRHNQVSPSGVVAAVKIEGAVKSAGPDPMRFDSAAGGGAAAEGQEENDGASSLQQSHPQRRAATDSVGRCDNLQHSTNDPFGTKRHSSQMADLWRTQMPERDAVAIWDACVESNVMQELQYSI